MGEVSVSCNSFPYNKNAFFMLSELRIHAVNFCFHIRVYSVSWLRMGCGSSKAAEANGSVPVPPLPPTTGTSSVKGIADLTETSPNTSQISVNTSQSSVEGMPRRASESRVFKLSRCFTPCWSKVARWDGLSKTQVHRTILQSLQYSAQTPSFTTRFPRCKTLKFFLDSYLFPGHEGEPLAFEIPASDGEDSSIIKKHPPKRLQKLEEMQNGAGLSEEALAERQAEADKRRKEVS